MKIFKTIKIVKKIIKQLKNANHEGTESPYWLILDPNQNMDCDIHRLANQITGPFFCREEAQEFLDNTNYNFSKRAKVYCHSGYYSYYYKMLNRALNKKV